MTGRAFSAFSIFIILVAINLVIAVPVQLQGGMNILQHEDYGSPAAEYLAKYLEDRGVAEARNLDGIGGGRFIGQIRRGLDSLSGGAFGDGKKFLTSRRIGSLIDRPVNFEEVDRFAKRNIDEIDRTAFDSFFKRNLDEIDRVGWSGFVKRLENYQAARQPL